VPWPRQSDVSCAPGARRQTTGDAPTPVAVDRGRASSRALPLDPFGRFDAPCAPYAEPNRGSRPYHPTPTTRPGRAACVRRRKAHPVAGGSHTASHPILGLFGGWPDLLAQRLARFGIGGDDHSEFGHHPVEEDVVAISSVYDAASRIGGTPRQQVVLGHCNEGLGDLDGVALVRCCDSVSEGGSAGAALVQDVGVSYPAVCGLREQGGRQGF